MLDQPLSDNDEEHSLVAEYVYRFGPLPDFRLMAPDDLAVAMDKIREALDRDRAPTLEEWGLPDDLPADVTI